MARAALAGPRMGGMPGGSTDCGVRWSRARRVAAASQGAASGSSRSTGLPYGQKVTGRPCDSTAPGLSGGRRMPSSRGCAETAIRAASSAGSVSAACAFATVPACRTTVPSGRSASTEVSVPQTQASAAG